MSFVIGDIAGLRTWTEEEILWREQVIQKIKFGIEDEVRKVNQAWRFIRVECPFIIPRSVLIAYPDEDVFGIKSNIGAIEWALRAETTAGSYAAATMMLRAGNVKPPVCVWQAGQSFRTEKSDGATAAKLRFNQFWQLEFQMIYTEDTKWDVAEASRNFAATAIAAVLPHRELRVVDSDRLPGYSDRTVDIEAAWKNDFIEVASTSERNDFHYSFGTKKLKVFEIAIGLDRLIHVAAGGI